MKCFIDNDNNKNRNNNDNNMDKTQFLFLKKHFNILNIMILNHLNVVFKNQ